MSNSNHNNNFDSTSANSGQSSMEFHPSSMAYETEPLPDDADAAAPAASFSAPTSTRAQRGDAGIDNNNSDSSATAAINPRRTSMPEMMMEQSHRRASIQRIMRDAELSQLEKQRSIQFLMDGRKLLQRRVTVECGSTFGCGSTATSSSVMGSNRSSFTVPAAAAAAAASRHRRNAMGGESDEDNDADSGMEDDDDDCDDNTNLRRRRRSSSYENGKSDVPDYDAITAAAIAHAKSQTASDLFASQHPYKATTTVVPAIAAQASASALLESRQQQQQQLHQHPHQQAPHHGSSIACARSAIEMAPKCTHYQRNCHIVSPCCGAIFACRICHDDFPVLPPPLLLSSAGGCNNTNNNSQQHQRMLRTSSMPVSFANSAEEHHTLPRYAIKEIICRKCFTKQSSKTNFCINCNVQFGEYHCAICNLWMSNEERPYHCPDCGFCRVGGLENFRHCLDCGMCIDRQLFNDHNCMAGKYMSDCPVCQEDLFSSRAASHELPCGHAIHWHCFQQLANHDSRCPICKKTAETQERMKPTWDAIAMGIASQPVPPELCKVVSIICNDCEATQTNRAWHFWGVQCRACDSFNTVVDRIIMMGEEAHEFLQREMQPPLPGGSSSIGAQSSVGAGIQSPGIHGSGGFGDGSVGANSPTVAGARTSSSPCPRPRTRRRATIQEPPPPPPFM